jgi:hypothetical protein
MPLTDSKFFPKEKAAKEKADRDAKDRQNQLMADLQKTFETPHGLRALDWILGICHVGGSVFTGNSRTFYNSGQQDIGQAIVDNIELADDTIYPKLLRLKADKLKEKKEAKEAK